MTHGSQLSPAQKGRLEDLGRLSVLHALVGPRTTFQRHEPHRKDTLDLKGGSDEYDTQYTNK